MSPKFRIAGEKQGWFKIVLIFADGILIAVVTLLSLWMRNLLFQQSGSILDALRMFYLATFLIFFVGMYLADAFNMEALRSQSEILIAVVKGVIISVVLASAIEFTMGIHFFPRGYIFLFAIISMPFFYAERELIVRLWHLKHSTDKILMLGKLSHIKTILERIRKREKELFVRIKALVIPDEDVDEIYGIPVVKLKERKITELIDELGINRVIVVSPLDYRNLLNDLHSTTSSNIKIEVVPGIYEILIGRPDYSLLADVPLIQLTRNDPPEWYYIAKRAMDIVISLVFLLFSLPLFILIPIAIKLTSKGPVFHKQKRVGKDFKPFTIYKFRTMVEGAEKENREVVDPNDPRITPIGRILRKYHIDELPQFINVIKGDMSLVGPRPEKIEFFKNYINRVPGYVERQKVKPGLTGLAQVWGDHTIDPEFKLKYDLIYIYNRSILVDIMILLKTIKVVFKGRGI